MTADDCTNPPRVWRDLSPKADQVPAWKALGFLGPDVRPAAKKRILISEVLFQSTVAAIILGTWFSLSLLRQRQQDKRLDA